ncbi:unnamed protein product, partial [Prunus brigantina]
SLPLLGCYSPCGESLTRLWRRWSLGGGEFRFVPRSSWILGLLGYFLCVFLL